MKHSWQRIDIGRRGARHRWRCNNCGKEHTTHGWIPTTDETGPCVDADGQEQETVIAGAETHAGYGAGGGLS